jgi:low temperature requirement protein LtrA
MRAVSSEEGHRVTTLELFFDLAFVFAFTQVSRLMAERHDALGVLQALVVLGLLWWSWTAYGWLANLAHADAGVVRVAMLVAMTAVFVAGLAVPEAYREPGGSTFAPVVLVAAYLAARLTHAVVFTAVEDAELRRRAAATAGLAMIPSGALLAIGVVLGPPWQAWCWLAAVAVEPAVTFVTSRGVDWSVRSAAHLTERYGLIVILALGESIVAVGVGVAAAPVSAPILCGVLLALVISVALWWAYFARLSGLAEHALVRLDGTVRARAATDGYTYLHLVLVAGIVAAALGVEVAMGHIDEPSPFGLLGAAALGGGVACYLAGTGLFARRVIGSWPLARFAAAALLLSSVPLLARIAPMAALAVVALLLVALLVVEPAHRQPGGAVHTRRGAPIVRRGRAGARAHLVGQTSTGVGVAVGCHPGEGRHPDRGPRVVRQAGELSRRRRRGRARRTATTSPCVTLARPTRRSGCALCVADSRTVDLASPHGRA